VLPLVQQYELAGRKLNLLAGGRVVNLAAAQGHPAEVMDISFALQALAIEWLARHGEGLDSAVVPVPEEIDHEVARLKLESLGVGDRRAHREQRAYLSSWLR
jgi:adenosylhomocysteinase